jgi:hypothetical protein
MVKALKRPRTTGSVILLAFAGCSCWCDASSLSPPPTIASCVFRGGSSQNDSEFVIKEFKDELDAVRDNYQSQVQATVERLGREFQTPITPVQRNDVANNGDNNKDSASDKDDDVNDETPDSLVLPREIDRIFKPKIRPVQVKKPDRLTKTTASELEQSQFDESSVDATVLKSKKDSMADEFANFVLDPNVKERTKSNSSSSFLVKTKAI